MTYTSDYGVTRETINELCSPMGVTVDKSNLSNTVFKLIDSRINGTLIKHGTDINDIPVDDKSNLLWSTTIFFIMENLCNRGLIAWSTGDIQERQVGKSEVKFQAWQPLFFFARGASEDFMGLLPHETWRMMGSHYLSLYIDATSELETAVIKSDDTSRGWNWNRDYGSYISDDELSRYG